MAIAFDAISSGSGSGAGPWTFSHTCSGSDRILWVIYGIQAGQAASAITYNGVALTPVHASAGTTPRLSVWYLINPDSGTNTISITPASSVGNTGSFVGVSYTGVDQSSPLGTGASAAATSATPSVVVTSDTDEVIFAAIVHHDPTNNTLVWTDENDRIQVGTGSGTSFVRTSGADEAGAASVTISAALTGAEAWKIWAQPMIPADVVTPASFKPRFMDLTFGVHKKTKLKGLRSGLTAASGPLGTTMLVTKAVRPKTNMSTRAELMLVTKKGRASGLTALGLSHRDGIVPSVSGLALFYTYNQPWNK